MGITQTQADDITANNAKTGITAQQATDITTNNAKVGVIAGGTTGQALVKASGSDYDTEWADAASGVQYHERFATDAETFRSGATDTVELYYTAKADGDGLAESASSDTPTAGKIIKRKIYYSEAAFADPDTGTWVEFTPAPADDASFATVKAALLEYLKARTGGTVPISLKQTWEEVSATAYLLDETFGSGAEAAYSTRQLRFAQTDCMVIRRASDSTTTTIGFDGSGNIDEAAITTFCTGTTCTVYQWLDQSGNGNTATAPSTGEEPTIYTGGALVKENGKVALDFNEDKLHATFTYAVTAQSTYGLGVFVDGTTDRFISQVELGETLDYQGDEYIQAYRSATNTIASLRNNGAQSGIVVSNNSRILFTSEHTGSSLRNYVNGYAGTAYANTLNNTFVKLLIKSSTGPSSEGMAGTMQEVLMYPSNKSSFRTDIEENIGDYFTQNTPLLDTYTGAAAAYSLRKLSSSYSGSAVEVYNGSSYADIGFNVFGELDTVALAAHCGSNSGYVSKWYDQSGNTNTAAQTTTANMPKIYDGTTGVVTENGKPAVDFNVTLNYLEASFNSITAYPLTNVNVTSCRVSSSVTILNDSTSALVQFGNSYGEGKNRIMTRNGILYRGGPAAVFNQQNLNFLYWTDSTTRAIAVNGATPVSVAGTTTFPSIDVLAIGATLDATPAGYYDGLIQEVVWWAVDQDTAGNRTGIETNVNTFYSIF